MCLDARTFFLSMAHVLWRFSSLLGVWRAQRAARKDGNHDPHLFGPRVTFCSFLVPRIGGILRFVTQVGAPIVHRIFWQIFCPLGRLFSEAPGALLAHFAAHLVPSWQSFGVIWAPAVTLVTQKLCVMASV